jgi:5-methylcytosine-specific restriction endonuclease McrA
MVTSSHPCLLLSHDYTPLKILSIKQTFRLMFNEKVDVVLEYADKVVRTVNRAFKVPAVMRLLGKVSLHFQVKLSRRNVFVRDRYTCQYCGKAGTNANLTLDHCTPRSRGGRFSWDNLVTACIDCNSRKGNRTPSEAGMGLIRGMPKRMEVFEYLQNVVNFKYRIPEWSDFLKT